MTELVSRLVLPSRVSRGDTEKFAKANILMLHLARYKIERGRFDFLQSFFSSFMFPNFVLFRLSLN